MVTMAQIAANWRNTHTHMDRLHPLTHLHQHSYNHITGAKRQLSYYFSVHAGMSPKRHRAIRFEACCHWALLNVQMTTVLCTLIYCTELHLSFCNFYFYLYE